MRFLRSFVATSLAAGAFATKKAPENRFNEFHEMALASSPVQLNSTSYTSLTSKPRDYSVAVLLTALESRFGCQLCREFQPEWDLLAKTWTKGDKKAESRLIFGTLDFSNGREVFMSLGLQTAPVLVLHQPTTGPHAVASADALRYDFGNGPQSAEKVHAWLARHLPDRPHPPMSRPINWVRLISVTTIVLGAGTGFITAWPYVLPIIQNRNLWAAISLIAVLLFTSGHMFNHIRKVPYVSGNGRGGISYFAGGFQNQFGLETQIVAAIYGIMSFCVISLSVKVPRIGNNRTQQVAVLTWGGVLFVVYSLLLSVFRGKNGSYPFSLPPFM